MRLIDADALKTKRGMAHRCEDCKHNARMCQSNQDYTRMDICGMLADAPTIDAIPVEWLREKIKEHTDEEGWQDYLANSFGLCIEEWQKEQEAR